MNTSREGEETSARFPLPNADTKVTPRIGNPDRRTLPDSKTAHSAGGTIFAIAC